MSLQCPSSPIYRTSAEHKRHARDAAVKRRGTPKVLRDLLREKCRIRMHELRQSNFQKSRKLVDSFPESESNEIDEILRQELAELEKDVELQDEMFREIRAEADAWFVEQLEKEENYLIEVGESDGLICPVCQKAVMDFDSSQSLYKCGCGINFLFTGNSQQLHATLERNVEEHGKLCDACLLFYVEPYPYVTGIDTNLDGSAGLVLSAMCDNCDYFVSF